VAIIDDTSRLGLWRIEDSHLAFNDTLFHIEPLSDDIVVANGSYGVPLRYWRPSLGETLRGMDDGLIQSIDPLSGRALLRKANGCHRIVDAKVGKLGSGLVKLTPKPDRSELHHRHEV
jgi:hypothetical protein